MLDKIINLFENYGWIGLIISGIILLFKTKILTFISASSVELKR
ncbi:hypothetical protein J2S11_001610 [Bacillus horti]|uniref:Uncharacterized protein n=1 Tax=Caldalkalibacillus horti TaxID=77523 RepID=A0ABT9VXV6_9BACI|nr:hypothetical protein [Bacillus horti]